MRWTALMMVRGRSHSLVLKESKIDLTFGKFYNLRSDVVDQMEIRLKIKERDMSPDEKTHDNQKITWIRSTKRI